MESQPQNPEFRNNPVNFHKCITTQGFGYSPQHHSMTIINHLAKALGLIIESQVDTSGDNQNF